MKIRLNLELLFVSLKTLLYQKGGGIKILDEKSLSKTIEWTPVDKLPQESFYWADGAERWTELYCHFAARPFGWLFFGPAEICQRQIVDYLTIIYIMVLDSQNHET